MLMFFTTFTSFAILASAISPPILSIWFWREPSPHKWIYDKPKHPKHTTTMVSHLPLWQHGFGKSAHPTPRSCFRRVCLRAGLKGLASFYCMAEKKIIIKLNDLF
jgi:hypothetical protein